MVAEEQITAAAVLIGNELLSGSVKDKNLHYIATSLLNAGITLREVRVIPDDCEAIVDAVNTLRASMDYVFTTGGIGPTHDDITAECIAKAFGRDLIQHAETAETMRAYFTSKGVEANDERMRMANMPDGAEPVRNEHSVVPGFRMENVYVLAGVPSVMRSMMDAAIPLLRRGRPIYTSSVRCDLQEGSLARGLADIQNAHPGVDIGSYPLSKAFNYDVSLVVRGTDEALVAQVIDAIVVLIGQLNGSVLERH
ncbi:MAG TPA: competence/damage-inducible protein A [Gammaproteobacteria bacterium]|nr:competence/damage-inducible protein A [Gammaproteobacteria bacterium]